MKMYRPSSFLLRYVRAEMNVHAFMNELDQKDYWYPRKIKFFKNLCTVRPNKKETRFISEISSLPRTIENKLYTSLSRAFFFFHLIPNT